MEVVQKTSTKYVLHQSAYVKLILHALKYPSQAVNGVLLGVIPKGSGLSSGEIVGGTAVEIVDAVPLFHHHLGLAPMLEIALSQVDEHFSQEKPALEIIGYYHANERIDDTELGSIARQIGSSIARNCPQACILQVDNSLLQPAVLEKHPQPAVQLYIRDGSRGWRLAGDKESSGGVATAEISLQRSSDAAILADFVEERRQSMLSDFDDHLEDISRDYLNVHLFD